MQLLYLCYHLKTTWSSDGWARRTFRKRDLARGKLQWDGRGGGERGGSAYLTKTICPQMSTVNKESIIDSRGRRSWLHDCVHGGMNIHVIGLHSEFRGRSPPLVGTSSPSLSCAATQVIPSPSPHPPLPPVVPFPFSHSPTLFFVEWFPRLFFLGMERLHYKLVPLAFFTGIVFGHPAHLSAQEQQVKILFFSLHSSHTPSIYRKWRVQVNSFSLCLYVFCIYFTQ